VLTSGAQGRGQRPQRQPGRRVGQLFTPHPAESGDGSPGEDPPVGKSPPTARRVKDVKQWTRTEADAITDPWSYRELEWRTATAALKEGNVPDSSATLNESSPRCNFSEEEYTDLFLGGTR